MSEPEEKKPEESQPPVPPKFNPPKVREPGGVVAEHEMRRVVDDLLLKGMPARRIVLYMRNVHNAFFKENDILNYNKNYFKGENGLVSQIIKASQDLVNHDPPPGDDKEMLASFFTLKKTREDLDMIYDRIREMREYAKKYPFDDSYDARIIDYLGKAEGIRTRVFRHQYEMIRKAIILNIGKKIVMAAINIFLPYIHSDKRKEAVSRFENLIKPMLGLTSTPDEPVDISAIRADTEGEPEHGDIIDGEATQEG